MKPENYKTILYRQEDGSWVAEIPAIPGCYALIQMIADEYREKGCNSPPTPPRS